MTEAEAQVRRLRVEIESLFAARTLAHLRGYDMVVRLYTAQIEQIAGELLAISQQALVAVLAIRACRYD